MSMALHLIHVSDIHFGSGESHGRLNPETGQNVRFEDFVTALSKVVDYSIEKGADVFLFSGDAYRNASPEPIYQKMFAEQLKRLSDAKISTILLVGNHDQILKATGSHSMSVFQSLEVPNLITIDRPCLKLIDTKNGALQVVGIPHVTKNILMTQESYSSLPANEIDKVLVRHVREILNDLYEALDPKIPAVATAHIMVDTARAGAEQELMVGYSMSFPLDLFVHENLDYVALGHVHRQQVLREKNPAIAYAGSLERVDFGEAEEDKGFIHVEISRKKVNFEFHSIGPRPFLTVEADLTSCEKPTEELANRVKKQLVPGCVMRVHYKIKQEQQHLVDENEIRQVAAAALSVKLRSEIIGTARDFRMPQLDEKAAVSPLSAMAAYLDEVAPDRKEVLLRKATDLASKLDSE
jgi:DNA repair protein SbcD/Mre11